MRHEYVCAECGASNHLPLVVKTVTCHRCGDVCLVTDGKLTRFYPSLHMMPIDYVPADSCYAVSKWMPTHTRPVASGVYECRFRHIEPTVLRLWWNGVAFLHAGKRVDMTQFLTWRGVLG